MKTKKYSSLGLDVNLSVPESVEEFDLNAKRKDACLDEATNNVVYRGVLNGLRELFLYGQDEDKEKELAKFDGIEQRTGIINTMVPTGEKKKDGTAIMKRDLSDAKFFEKVLAQLGVEASHFQSVMNEVAGLVEFDASAIERTGPKIVKIGQNWIDAAKDVIANDKFGKLGTQYHKFVGKEIVLPTAVAALASDASDEAKTKHAEAEKQYINQLARLIKQMWDAKTEQELKAGKVL